MNLRYLPTPLRFSPPPSPLFPSPHPHSSYVKMQEAQIRPEEYLELYITALLCLNHKRAQRRIPSSMVTPILRLSRSTQGSLRGSRNSTTSLTGPPRSPNYLPRAGSSVDLESIPPPFAERKAVKIACGWHHAAFITGICHFKSDSFFLYILFLPLLIFIQ